MYLLPFSSTGIITWFYDIGWGILGFFISFYLCRLLGLQEPLDRDLAYYKNQQKTGN